MLQGKTQNEQAVVKYIYYARRDNFADQEIISVLKEKDWNEQKIKNGFSYS